MSLALISACSIAFSAAFVAMSLVVSSLAAMRRSLMPVRVVIHSSLVSTMLREILIGQNFLRHVTAGADDRDGAIAVYRSAGSSGAVVS